MRPYLLVSDLHAHSWSQFARTNEDGINSRLVIILDELERAAVTLANKTKEIGPIVMAGDLFHTRGSIDPEVFNPVHDRICKLIEAGFRFVAIPGNHDLKSKETTALGNAMQSLDKLDGFTVVTEPCFDSSRAFIPWCSTMSDLRDKVSLMLGEMDAAGLDPAKVDLIIHAGINGVLMNMPDHGIDAAEVLTWGFGRVFAGHYHNHKSMQLDRVISIGATTHQTWSDIGTKAGFLIVEEDGFEYQASHGPSFVEVTSATDPDEIPLLADGNYLRVRDFRLTDAEVQLMRKELIGFGALGVSFQVAREVVSARGAAPTKVSSLDESIDGFITTKLAEEDPAVIATVKANCADIISTARSVSLEAA